MNSYLYKLTFLVLFMLFANSKVLAEISIVVHPSNTVSEISESNLRAIFLGKQRKFTNDKIAVPIMQKGAVMETFSLTVLKKKPSQLKAYWSKQLFTGGGQPPKEVADDSSVLELISSNENMVGFIDSANVDSSVKVILTM